MPHLFSLLYDVLIKHTFDSPRLYIDLLAVLQIDNSLSYFPGPRFPIYPFIVIHRHINPPSVSNEHRITSPDIIYQRELSLAVTGSYFLDGFGEDLNPVLSFLVSFKGLRHLYLKLSNFAENSGVESVIKYHQSTLESLSDHERRLVAIDEEGIFEEDRDLSPKWISSQWDVLNPSRLTALSLCTSPSIMVSYDA